MSKKIIAQNEQVVIGADVHTRKHVVTARTADGEYHGAAHIHPSRAAWEEYLGKFPGCRIHVAYEAGPHGYNLHDWICGIRKESGVDVNVEIAPPAHVPKVPGKKSVKTDKRDSRDLIYAVEMKSFEAVVVPDRRRREERQVLRTRQALVEQRTQLENQIHGAIKFHGIQPPEGNAFTKKWLRPLRGGIAERDTTGCLCLALDALLSVLESIDKQIAILDRQVKRIIEEGACGETARKIRELTGIGDISAATIAVEVAGFAAFRNSEAFASYVGLVPGESSSGDSTRRGRITRAGNSRLRRIFVECAWAWLRYDASARKIFFRIMGGKDERKNTAIVALARRLAVKVYHRVVNGPPERAAA
jgi:transposase